MISASLRHSFFLFFFFSISLCEPTSTHSPESELKPTFGRGIRRIKGNQWRKAAAHWKKCGHSVNEVFGNEGVLQERQFNEDSLALLQGSFGPFGTKVGKRVRKWVPGASRPQGPKSRKRSRKGVKIDCFSTILTLFRLRFRLFERPRELILGLIFVPMTSVGAKVFATIQWRGRGDSVNRWTLRTGIFCVHAEELPLESQAGMQSQKEIR